uniref:Uncharacterized protein n=1 Tax=Rhodnius prolixus TaxID=13249 RepID=T1HLY7_RHOPR
MAIKFLRLFVQIRLAGKHCAKSEMDDLSYKIDNIRPCKLVKLNIKTKNWFELFFQRILISLGFKGAEEMIFSKFSYNELVILKPSYCLVQTQCGLKIRRTTWRGLETRVEKKAHGH